MNNKSFVFNFKENCMFDGEDVLDYVVVITLKYNGKNAYFYSAKHGDYYHGFNSFWKIQHKDSDSEIWHKIFELDKQGYICFNDIYDKLDNDYDRHVS